MSETCDVVAFFQFIVNVQPSGSRIPDAWSIKLKLSLIKTFCLTESENRTKKFQS